MYSLTENEMSSGNSLSENDLDVRRWEPIASGRIAALTGQWADTLPEAGHTQMASPRQHPALASPQRPRRISQVLRVMVTVDLLHHIDRHPDQARRLPWIDASLQHPGHRGVPQHMRRHSGE